MEKGNNKNSKYFLPSFIPSFLSVLLVEHPPSGWCFTDETVSHTEKDMTFFPTKRKLSPSAKIKLSQIVYVTRKQSWNKLKTVIIPNTSNWQLKIDGRRCQEIWKKMFNLSFRCLKTSPNYFLFFSHLIKIYRRNHNRCKILLN